ncbi:Gfo/Idh/MocA family oxidoreductase [Kibdelosporangium philippinense]|uniref:Gfo/Idh/MocA family oxidoreductase n=1 Tax=Kibdelosporangium philippinense TaxID=211113 RepID=A0ABS8Z5U9_9PSEU|nr:Gfo/Idh/MocA family oxidoreductase [Kibdelosporangium philippinense]MCE7003225.1 Gfo/Idh/MocA family oxidoreductase [Kibdelosporangium philippinense]
MTDSIRVAIVGCGVIGRNHARAIGEHPAFEVVAAVDPVPENSAALLAEFPSPVAYSTLADALRECAVDLVVICTPSGTHLDLAREAVTAGKHVVIEKPLDVNVARAAEFAGLAKQAADAGQMITVISQHRFDPASVAVARAVHGGRFGKPTSGAATVSWWREQSYYDSGDWRGTWQLDGGGALMNQGVHTVDLLCWFLGRPLEVQASARLLAHERVEVEDTVAATVVFESGAIAVLLATTAAYPGLTARIQIHGSEGSAVIDNDRLEYFHAKGSAAGHEPGGAGSVTGGAVSGNQAEAEVGLADTPAGPRTEHDFVLGHRRQYDDIAHAVSTGARPRVTIEDALMSLAFVRAIYVSAALGERIAVADVLDGKYSDVRLELKGR